MNWDAIGAISEVAGTATVVISVLYLAVQVRQSNRQSASASGTEVLGEMNRLQEFVFSDPNGAALLLKLKSGEELTPEEEIKAHIIADRALNTWYSGQQSYLNGIMTDELFQDIKDDAIRFTSSYPYLRNFMADILGNYEGASKLEVYQHIYDVD
ncbi:MAG: hypothetical protein ACU84Q_01445 [Gammaproteobacteria bacterium]